MNQRKVGALFSYINMALHILIGLVYVPLLLKYLSVEEYGLYQLIGSLVAYLSIMDFGLSATITRYYSQRLALNDTKGQENVLAIAFMIYLGIGVLVILAGIWLYTSLEFFYGATLSREEMVSAKAMMVLLIFNVALTIPSNVFTAAITSHEKFVFLRSLSIVRNLINPILVLAVLQFRASALSVVQVQVVLNIAVIFFSVWYAKHAIKIRFHFHSFDKDLVKSMFAFAFFIFLNAIVDQIYWKTGQLILGAFSGTAAVAVFSVSLTIVRYYMQFSTSINGVFLPHLSRLAALGDDMTQINALFIRVGRVQYIILGLILSGFVIFGRMFILLWVGAEFSTVYIIALVMMVPFTIDLIQNLGLMVLQAKNKHSVRSIVYLIIAIFNVVLSIPMAKMYGGLGCAISTGVCLFFGNGVFLNLYYHKIGIDIFAFFKEILKLSFPMMISGVLGYVSIYLLHPEGWISFFALVSVYIVLYFLIVYGLGFNHYEKQLVHSVLWRISKKCMD